MSSCRRDQLLTVAVEALFASGVPLDGSPVDIRAAIRDTLGRLRIKGCAGCVAQEFGDHPDAAVERMCRCRAAVHNAYQEVSR